MGDLNNDKIPHGKIIISTLLKVLLMIVIIITLNSWPSIKQSFNGQTPPFEYWLDHSIKPSNIILILGFGAYFYYKDLTDRREKLKA
jgi:hypothetical protein